MNRSQLRIVVVAAIAVASVSLAGAVFPTAIGAQTQSVSSGVFVDQNRNLEDPPGPSGLNLSDTPWLQAYYQYFEPSNDTRAASVGPGRDAGGGADLLSALVAVGTAVTVLTGLGAVVWLRWLWATPDGFDERPDRSPPAESAPPDDPPSVGDVDPSNEVYRAWCELVGLLPVSSPEAMTPRELSRAAVNHGFDREAVESLTRAFEAVRYDEATAASEYESWARAALDRIDQGDEQ